jgi:peptide/nickel transport system ATP-binding protein
MSHDMSAPGETALLRARDLSIHVGDVEVVDIDELTLWPGRHLAIVGESGSGKTMTALGLIGLQTGDAVVRGSVTFGGQELVGLTERRLGAIRGARIGVVFQDALRALNPTMPVGRQIEEALRLHERLGRAERRARVLSVLERVRLPEPAALARRYPHELSGGQRQRVLIAGAIVCRPRVLIADEPTTALDVTVQAEILQLLGELSADGGMSVLLVSHDLGVVRSLCHDVAVMYGGRIVERGPVAEVIGRPRHRYTKALIEANPRFDPAGFDPRGPERTAGRLRNIPGTVPAIGRFPAGCPFRGRCDAELPDCATFPGPVERERRHLFHCWNPITYDQNSPNQSEVRR